MHRELILMDYLILVFDQGEIKIHFICNENLPLSLIKEEIQCMTEKIKLKFISKSKYKKFKPRNFGKVFSIRIGGSASKNIHLSHICIH